MKLLNFDQLKEHEVKKVHELSIKKVTCTLKLYELGRGTHYQIIFLQKRNQHISFETFEEAKQNLEVGFQLRIDQLSLVNPYYVTNLNMNQIKKENLKWIF